MDLLFLLNSIYDYIDGPMGGSLTLSFYFFILIAVIALLIFLFVALGTFYYWLFPPKDPNNKDKENHNSNKVGRKNLKE